jgi:hypothetical protein
MSNDTRVGKHQRQRVERREVQGEPNASVSGDANAGRPNATESNDASASPNTINVGPTQNMNTLNSTANTPNMATTAQHKRYPTPTQMINTPLVNATVTARRVVERRKSMAGGKAVRNSMGAVRVVFTVTMYAV